MSFQPPPIIHLTIDHMKHSILASIDEMGAGYKKTIQEAVNNFFDSYDFEQQIQSITESLIKQQLKLTIENALRDVFQSEAVQKQFQEFFLKVMKETKVWQFQDMF